MERQHTEDTSQVLEQIILVFSSFTKVSFQDEGLEDDLEEKARLISQVLELQNTLEDLSSKVDNVKEENLRLRSENQVLGQYIENLMTASQVFQTTEDPRSPRYK